MGVTQAARRDFEVKRMTALAAMIDRVDQEVGRLITDLRSNNELENTLILFVSDNGACPYDRRSTRLEAEPTSGDVSWSDSTGWAWARNTPFRFYKQNQFEGGVRTPAIVHWTAGLRTPPGSIVCEPAHLVDVMPTLAEIGQCEVPHGWPGRDLRPISGVSLAPIFRGETLPSRGPIHYLFSKDRALRDGDWKVVSFRGEAWELYNLATDPTELKRSGQIGPGTHARDDREVDRDDSRCAACITASVCSDHAGEAAASTPGMDEFREGIAAGKIEEEA